MLRSLPRDLLPSPARLSLSNPNSPSLQSPSTSKPTSQGQLPTTLSNPIPSLLPPLPRARALLSQITSLAAKIFDASPNFIGSIPPVDFSASPKEFIFVFTSLKTQLLEAIVQLEEINQIIDLEDTKKKLNQEIKAKNSCILSFAKKLKEAERVLDMLVEDYADYRCPKRVKSEETENPFTSTVASQVKLSDVLSYARKISYTTFATPGNGDPLRRGSLPPAPLEEQMRASQLYTFANLDVGLTKTVEKDKDIIIEPLVDTPDKPELDPLDSIKGLIPENFTVPVPTGWQPGMPVELPLDLPLPPAGWKPGDPITLPPLPPKDVHQKKPSDAPPVFSRASEVIHVKPININTLGDDDSSDDEFSSSELEFSADED